MSIISNCVINLSADKDRVLREAFRVLKPGGRFAVSDVVTRGEIAPEIRASVLAWVGCIAGALEENEYRGKLAAAGFEQIEIEPTRIYRVEDAREFLSSSGVDVDAMAAAGRWKVHERFCARGETETLTMESHYNVLFLCTGNSARSIMAEAILNHKGKPVFTAYSAGSNPSGTVRPEALKQLEMARIPTAGLRSKSWDEFGRPGAPTMHFVFTVCDNAAKETCPLWPGQPVTAHWGIPDPAAVQGTSAEIERAFREAFFVLDRRIGLFLSLPLAALDRFALKKEVDRIGKQ